MIRWKQQQINFNLSALCPLHSLVPHSCLDFCSHTTSKRRLASHSLRLFNQQTHSHVSDIKINLEALGCHVLRLFSPFFRSLFFVVVRFSFGSNWPSSRGKKKDEKLPPRALGHRCLTSSSRDFLVDARLFDSFH
jgi:hypothetical protein